MVAAIGGGMAMGAAMGPSVGAAAGVGDAGAAGTAGGTPTSLDGTYLPSNPATSAPTMSMSQLANFLKDFSSAEILIALMMASGGGGSHHPHKKDDSSDAAMALLAGFALGQAMSSNASLSSLAPSAGAAQPTTGTMLNVTV